MSNEPPLNKTIGLKNKYNIPAVFPFDIFPNTLDDGLLGLFGDAVDALTSPLCLFIC